MSNLLKLPHLHCLVYFVADKPTKENVSKEVPLVGTTSYRTLLEWIGDMDIDITRVRLYNQINNPFGNVMARASLNRAVELKQIAVIALGQKAATYLRKAGITNYFPLPHPSGRNRLLNNKKFVKIKLEACKKYIYEGVSNAS
jgi:hypothetical protein